MGFKFIDHSEQVKSQMAANVIRALNAIGLKAVELIVRKMKTGYKDQHQNLDMSGRKINGTHTDIRWHGDMMRDVSHEVGRTSANTVDVGVPENYATFVHEGTRFLKGRPFIGDALTEGKDEIQAVGAKYLKEGF